MDDFPSLLPRQHSGTFDAVEWVSSTPYLHPRRTPSPLPQGLGFRYTQLQPIQLDALLWAGTSEWRVAQNAALEAVGNSPKRLP